MARMLLQLSLAMVLILLLPLACNGGSGGGGGGSGGSGGGMIARPGCPDRCGDVLIPFPFGTKPGCYLDEDYLITCNSSTPAQTTFLGPFDWNVMVTNISLKGELEVLKLIAKDCYGSNGTQGRGDKVVPTFYLTAYTISATRNKFTAIGCDTYAILEGSDGGKSYQTGCMSLCDKEEYVNYGYCSGAGCCQITSFPSGLGDVTVELSSYYNHSHVHGFNPCSYAFIAEEGKFKFSNTSFQEMENTTTLPVVLDWSIGNESCSEASKRHNYTCCKNSMCVNSPARSGYLCQCLPGYQGNPYLPHGCKDIDECMDSNRCTNGRCNNLPGGYYCSCEVGYKLAKESACIKVDSRSQGSSHFKYIALIITVSTGFIALFCATLVIFWGVNERKLIKRKAKYFQQNGGFMLKQHLCSHRGSSETTKIFTVEEIRKATNNFHESRILGEGGYGTVYKGELSDKTQVAIKKSKLCAQTQTAQFINELVVLMQFNHMNVVKLLGCCLETEVPLLVYEFIPNGTLFAHIHSKGRAMLSPLSWELRMKIAAETAEALAYLHVNIVPPIIHRDVKTMNILLDENDTAKVSDFGISRLIPQDKDGLTTMVQGTLGYLDPEYFHSSQLTDKSDVYSFGVVLAELLTGRKALSFDMPEGERCLSNFFITSLDAQRLHHIIDSAILNHENIETIKEVANIAKRCLAVKGEDRPGMKEVAKELERLTSLVKKHSSEKVHFGSEETQNLLGESSVPHCLNIESGSSACITLGYDSMQSQMLMPYNNAR